MHYAYCIYFTITITIITCINITIIIMLYFRKNFGNFSGISISILWVIRGAKNEPNLDDERRRNQMVAKASIYFF